MCCHNLQPLWLQRSRAKAGGCWDTGNWAGGNPQCCWAAWASLQNLQRQITSSKSCDLSGYVGTFPFMFHLSSFPKWGREATAPRGALTSTDLYLGKGKQENKSCHISPWSCKIFQATRNLFGLAIEPIWHLPLQRSHKTQTHSPTQLLLPAGIPRDTLRMRFCLMEIFKHPFPQHTKPNGTFYLGAEQEKKHRRERGNTCSKKLLTT